MCVHMPKASLNIFYLVIGDYKRGKERGRVREGEREKEREKRERAREE